MVEVKTEIDTVGHQAESCGNHVHEVTRHGCHHIVPKALLPLVSLHANLDFYTNDDLIVSERSSEVWCRNFMVVRFRIRPYYCAFSA